MVGETPEKWRECVRKTIELAPDSVTIYQMEVPYNTTIFKEMKTHGRDVAPVADWRTKRGWVEYAFAGTGTGRLQRRQRLHGGEGSGEDEVPLSRHVCGPART